MKFTATAAVVAIAASLDIKPVRGDSLFDGKSPKRSPSSGSGGSLDEYTYAESTNFAGTYKQCSVVVTHSSASGDLDDTYRGCADENSSPVVFTITKTGDGYGAYKATTMPPEFVSDDFVMGGWQGFANGNTLSMSSFGAAIYSMFPARVAQPVLYNNSPNTMTCSLYQHGVMQCMADITEYCSKVSGEGELVVPYCEDREGEWLNTYSMKSVFVREGFACPSSPPGFCESLPLLGDPISGDTVAVKCGQSYSGDDTVVRLEDDLECSGGNTISGPDAAFTLTDGATLDCQGHELSMGDGVTIQDGVKMIDTATVRNCSVSKFKFSNAFIKSQSGVTTIADSTFSGSKYGAWVQQDYSQEGNVVVLKNVIASSNTRYGIYSPGAGGDNNSHKIKLEGNVRANDNGEMGIGFAFYNKIEVIGQVEVRNNAYGLLVFYPSSGYLTLIGDATFTACGNTYKDMGQYGTAEVNPHDDGAYFCETKQIGSEAETYGGKLPNCRPCDEAPE